MENVITKEIWQTGKFRELPEFSTQEGYYAEIKKFIKKYGEPLKKGMLLVRSGDDEENTQCYGASWTPDVNTCRCMAKWANFSETIYVQFVPKGTMAVHLPAKGVYEEEYVLDMEGKSKNVMVFARHKGDWDYSTDFETEEDYKNWELNSNACAVLNMFYKKYLKKLFGEDKKAA